MVALCGASFGRSQRRHNEPAALPGYPPDPGQACPECSRAGGWPVSTAELGDSLPEGVFHLLPADSDVASTYGGYVALCGEVMTRRGLPPSCYPEVGPGPDPRYCPACAREAARFSAEAGDRASGAVDQMATR